MCIPYLFESGDKALRRHAPSNQLFLELIDGEYRGCQGSLVLGACFHGLQQPVGRHDACQSKSMTASGWVPSQMPPGCPVEVKDALVNAEDNGNVLQTAVSAPSNGAEERFHGLGDIRPAVRRGLGLGGPGFVSDPRLRQIDSVKDHVPGFVNENPEAISGQATRF